MNLENLKKEIEKIIKETEAIETIKTNLNEIEVNGEKFSFDFEKNKYGNWTCYITKNNDDAVLFVFDDQMEINLIVENDDWIDVYWDENGVESGYSRG
jgi:phage/plasmid primase-like uncharacterized protein